jgi:tubulin polyglutamylase TTLL6/13
MYPRTHVKSQVETQAFRLRPPSESKVSRANLPKHTICINLTDCRYDVIRHVCQTMLKWNVITDDENNMNCDIMWNDTACNQSLLGKLKAFQKLNHFPGIFTIARKNFLAANLKKMQKQFPDYYNFFPVTYCLPYEKNKVFQEFYSKDRKKDRVFIVKPEASSEGRGIFLTQRLEDIPVTEGFVVQKYVKHPLLIDNLKFDLRIYVLVTSVAPLRIYIYKEGLARFATDEYIIPGAKNFANMCQHLTNYSINKHSKHFQYDKNPEKAESGHKRSLSAIWKLLEAQGVDTSLIFENIKSAVIKTISSIQPIMKHIYMSSQPDDFTGGMCFEILGFDVLIKRNLKPVVLEVNHAPSFNSDTPFDFKVKSEMLKNAFEILDVNIERRNFIIKKERAKFEERFQQGVRIKVPLAEKEKVKSEYISDLEEKVKDRIGLFELIYPKTSPTEPYEEFMSFSEKMHLQQAGVNIENRKAKASNIKHPNSLNRSGTLNPNKENDSLNTQLLIKQSQKLKFDQIQDIVNRLFLRNDNANKEARQKLERVKSDTIEQKIKILDLKRPKILNFDFSSISSPFL